MTDPQVAMTMLGLFIFLILLGFPICFTLIAMGVAFGFYAYYQPGQPLLDNNIFDLLVNQTYSVMKNEVLVAVPLFLYMGYILERANIVDRLFYSMSLAARAIPASMAVAALATCALFAAAVGIVGAVVTLMGLLAFPALLKAGYDEKLAAGVVCAGGCLGILIPPSIMLIVYAATAAVSVVQVYAAALIPGFLLAGLHILYVVTRALINPRVAPKPPKEDISWGKLLYMLMTSFVPLALLIVAVLGAILAGWGTPSEAAALGALGGLVLAAGYHLAAVFEGKVTRDWVTHHDPARGQWLEAIAAGGLVAIGLYVVFLVGNGLATALFGVPFAGRTPPAAGVSLGVGLVSATGFYLFGGRVPLLARIQPKTKAGHALLHSVGLTALIGLGLGALYLLGWQVLGLGGYLRAEEVTVWALDLGFYFGLVAGFGWRGVQWQVLKESVFLTVRASAMVCWLFVGSWTFASVFSYLGGHATIENFVLHGIDLSLGGLVDPSLTFLILAQIIIFFLGWPLEWSEIIIIFVPIFLPLLEPFKIDPLFFGVLVAVNLQTSFMTPPMAMACYYLKGIAPPHVQLVNIFRGCFPFLGGVLVLIVLLYNFPWLVLWLPGAIYGRY